MNRMKLVRSLMWFASGAAICACEQPVPDPVDPSRVEWSPYGNEDLGFRLEVPAHYEIHADGDGVVFTDDGRTALRVTHADRTEARNRGLWAQVDPTEAREYGETAGQFYRYRHYDGPTYVPTLAYVVRHRGKDLGVEFRTRRSDLDPVHEHVLATLELIEEHSRPM